MIFHCWAVSLVTLVEEPGEPCTRVECTGWCGVVRYLHYCTGQYQAYIGGVGQQTDLLLIGHIFLYNTEQIEKLVALKRFRTILIEVKKNQT